MGKITHIDTRAHLAEQAERLTYLQQALNARYRLPDGTVKRHCDMTVGDLETLFDGTAKCLDALPPMPESMKLKRNR